MSSTGSKRFTGSPHFLPVFFNIQTLFAEAEERSDYGFGYPKHVTREFERFLSCGVLAHGFAGIQCGRAGCTFERLVA